MPAPKSIRVCVSRFAASAAVAALAACASGAATTGPPQTAATIQPAAELDGQLRPAPPSSVRPQAAARGQQAPAAPPAPVGPAPSILHARAECWNKLEADRKAPRDLEKRAAIVQKCTEDRMRGMPATVTQ